MSRAGVVSISIDFELRWGVLDRVRGDFGAYREQLEAVPAAVEATVGAFDDRGIVATWAMVGSVACNGWDEWRARCPPWPHYENIQLRWDDSFTGSAKDEKLYFAPELADALANSNQEIGSHTFSHLYMQEAGVADHDVIADCAAMNELFLDRWGSYPRSFVFPRNQVGRTQFLSDAGITGWRSNPSSWYWDPTVATTTVRRMLRVADGLVPLAQRDAPHPHGRGPQPASHLVRFGLPDRLWSLHLRRLTAGAERAVRRGTVLHIWWHPHNLGPDVRRSELRLRTMLDRLTDTGVRFAPMNALATAAGSS